MPCKTYRVVGNVYKQVMPDICTIIQCGIYIVHHMYKVIPVLCPYLTCTPLFHIQRKCIFCYYDHYCFQSFADEHVVCKLHHQVFPEEHC